MKKFKTTNKQNIIFTLLAVVMMMLVVVGCSAPKQSETGKQTPVEPAKQTAQVTLYFSDDNATYLVPEEREVTIENQDQLAQEAINQLITGPTNPKIYPTIPKGTKLLSLQIKDGLATADFSTEIRTNHEGGSSGEYMTLYSIVNTLVKVDPSIKKVQILINGQKEESLVGHYAIDQPLDPDWKNIGK